MFTTYGREYRHDRVAHLFLLHGATKKEAISKSPVRDIILADYAGTAG